MTTVTSLTADRMLAIEAASVVDGDVIGGNLILTKHDGSQIDAGSVQGPAGPQGPMGQDLQVLTSASVLDVGLSGQIRAGRQFIAADFANLGLSAPAGLWNLSDLTDVSGNGRNLLNKGAVPFASGIGGVANTAAQFVGSVAQALYISDTGAGDPFKLKAGSFGGWMRTAKTGAQVLLSKWGGAGGSWSYWFGIGTTAPQVNISNDGASVTVIDGITNICDDRWHFLCMTFDGTMVRIYVDGVFDAGGASLGGLFSGNAPLNIGASQADSSNNAASPHFGRIDEVFITADVLSEDQIRNLYCAKVPHTLAVLPSRASLNVRRYRRGSALTLADFPTAPLRLYNFSGGSFADEGSQNSVLTNNNAVPTAGADGTAGNAFNFRSSASILGSDTGLPTAGPRSFGGWFKTTILGGQIVVQYGSSTFTGIYVGSTTLGCIDAPSGSDTMHGPYVADGLWHQAIVTEDNGAVDGIKRKLYVDGKLVATSTTFVVPVLGGFNYFRIGDSSTNTSTFNGSIDGVFVCGYVLTMQDVIKLYAKGSQALAVSPKNVGDHMEAMDVNNLYVTFDTLESTSKVDLRVAA
jgi:hypothetical protein